MANASGARITIGDDVAVGVEGRGLPLHRRLGLDGRADRPSGTTRIDQLLPYQVNAELMTATGNPDVKFMHCLPALHNTDTEIGRQIHDKCGLDALEVTDEVFESPASIVFDQAENRLHTIKAAMVATIGD